MLVPGGLALALMHPIVFLAILALSVLVAAWLVPKIWRFIKRLVGHSPRPVQPTLR